MGGLGFDQDVTDAVDLCPVHEGTSGELRSVVCAHGQRMARENRRLVEKPRDALARDAESTETPTHSWLQSSATVKHLTRPPVFRLSLMGFTAIAQVRLAGVGQTGSENLKTLTTFASDAA